MPIADIAELDELWWYQSAAERPTPRSIAQHLELVHETDLQWPIILCAEGRLMDGMHRVLKALLEKRTELSAVLLNPTPAPDFINGDVDALPYPDKEI